MDGAMQGAVLAPAVDHAVPLQPSVVAPLAQQLGHLSLGSTGTVRTPPAATPPLPPTTPSPTDTSSPPSMCLLPPCLEPSSHRTPQCHPGPRGSSAGAGRAPQTLPWCRAAIDPLYPLPLPLLVSPAGGYGSSSGGGSYGGGRRF